MQKISPFHLLSDSDAAKSQRVMQAILKMIKLDIDELKQAAVGFHKHQSQSSLSS